MVMRKKGSEAAYQGWDELIEKLKGNFKLDANGRPVRKQGQIPFDTPESVLKRHTYGFVRQMLQMDGGGLLEDVLEDLRSDLQPKQTKGKGKLKSKKPLRLRRVKFRDNPFHCALQMLSVKLVPEKPEQKKTSLFGRSVCTRFGRQLAYAHLHDIDPDLLIGFLHQSGNITEVCRKAADTNKREDWYLRKLNNAEDETASDTGFPLAVIDFDATAISLDGFPVRIGEAIATNASTRIDSSATLIKPHKNWQIDEQWYRNEGAGLGVSQRNLHEAREPVEIVEWLAELTVNIPIVYCYDMKHCSFWLDILMEAAGLKLDFELRDAGDYLGHDASKRAKLRALIQQEPNQRIASKRADSLCAALLELSME